MDRGERFDWGRERERLDVASIIARYLGPPPGRRGRGNWWVCPFHDDRNPSLQAHPDGIHWKCFGCDEHGDAADFVGKHCRLDFPEAVREIRGESRRDPSPARPSPRPMPAPRPKGLDYGKALALVEDSALRLWSEEGLDALEELVSLRGLDFATIQRARLGWLPSLTMVNAAGRPYMIRGLVIPWFDDGRLAKVNVRRPEGSQPKYLAAFEDGPALFPDPETVEPGLPAVVVEGEFDALLLGQELAGLASVVTLGAASIPASDEAKSALRRSPRWFIATDRDDAGERAAGRWTSARCRRVAPPEPFKDWTDAYRGGIDLRRWWLDRFDGIGLTGPVGLPALRWGPGLDDPTPGIVNDRPGFDPVALA